MDGIQGPVTEGNFLCHILNILSSYQLAYEGIHLYENNILWVMSLALRSSEMEN